MGKASRLLRDEEGDRVPRTSSVWLVAVLVSVVHVANRKECRTTNTTTAMAETSRTKEFLERAQRLVSITSSDEKHCSLPRTLRASEQAGLLL